MCACESPDEPTQKVTMPISICLPVREVYSAQAPEQRVFGDPGTTELFALPKYIYFFIVKQDGNSWKVWDVKTRSVANESGDDGQKLKAWEAKWDTVPYTGMYDTIGDMVYRFNEEIDLLLPNNGFNGRVYAVASAVPLTFNKAIAKEDSETDLLNMTFRFDGGQDYDNQVKANLQNIYSTPCNYKVGTSAHYYGSFYATQKVPHLDLLLYHVAAKVDLMWNVAEAKRDSVKISYVAATNLYDGPCYVFKPTENEIGDYATYAAAEHEGYTKELLNETTPCPGTQWNGRKYFYAIPYKNNDATPHYPLQLRLQKGGDDPTGNKYYWSVVETDVPSVWTPWIRGQITINKGKYNVGG